MTHTVIGLFNTTDQAKNAFQQLLSNGFVSNNVDMSARNAANNSSNRNQDTGDRIGNFFSSLFDDKSEACHYSDAVQNGKSLITVQAKSEDEANRAARLLDQYGALDIDQNELSANQKMAANATNQNATTSTNTKNADDSNSVKVMEEKLEVGKRTEQTGGVRLRSRIVKRPVEAKLRLREEHVTVDRQPVDRKATEGRPEELQARRGDDERARRSARRQQRSPRRRGSFPQQRSEPEEQNHSRYRPQNGGRCGAAGRPQIARPQCGASLRRLLLLIRAKAAVVSDGGFRCFYELPITRWGTHVMASRAKP